MFSVSIGLSKRGEVMKIAIVSTDNSRVVRLGGKHVHQNLLEQALKDQGHEVLTFYPEPIVKNHEFKKAMLAFLSEPTIVFARTVEELKYKAKLGYYRWFFKRLALREFDVVHCHDVLSASSVKAKRIVLTLHGYFAKEVLNYNSFPDILRERVYNYCLKIEKKGIDKASHIICVDSRIKEYVVESFGYPADNVSVIYNAVDTERFHPVSDEEKISLRKHLSLPVNKLIVLVPRRYVDKNGVVYAAKAFSKMVDEDFYFVFAGEGPLKATLEEILRGKENAIVMNGIDNEIIDKYYQASDVVLVPSITSNEGVEEATSLSMLEGMACGKVVVCTNVGGMKEVIKDGENGFLIEQKNEDVIIEKLLFIKQNIGNLADLRKNAREYVVKNHSYIEHAKKVLKIYELVLAKDLRNHK